nr:MAG TPA: hypothetical protein [Caudoviricetes sp.]
MSASHFLGIKNLHPVLWRDPDGAIEENSLKGLPMPLL